MYLLRKMFSSESTEEQEGDSAEVEDAEDDKDSSKESQGTDTNHTSPSMAMRIMIASFRKKFPTVKGVNTEVVQKWFQQGAASTNLQAGQTGDADKRKLVIVDTRPENEYIISHLPGAVRIEFTTEDKNYIIREIQDSVKDEEKRLPKTIIMYCSLGYRSSILADKLQKAIKSKDAENDLSDAEIYNMEGGIFKWANEGAPMVDVSGSPTKSAHPFNAVFGKLLDHSLRKDKL